MLIKVAPHVHVNSSCLALVDTNSLTTTMSGTVRGTRLTLMIAGKPKEIFLPDHGAQEFAEALRKAQAASPLKEPPLDINRELSAVILEVHELLANAGAPLELIRHVTAPLYAWDGVIVDDLEPVPPRARY